MLAVSGSSPAMMKPTTGMMAKSEYPKALGKGRFSTGGFINANTKMMPTVKMMTDQMSRPAGWIHGSQSGSRLGIGPDLLPLLLAVILGPHEPARAGRDGFLSRYLWAWHIGLSGDPVSRSHGPRATIAL